MNQKAIDLTHALAYQLTPGIHTYGTCSKGNCKNTARGSAHCPACVVGALAEEIGTEVAGRLHMLYNKRADINNEIQEIIGEF